MPTLANPVFRGLLINCRLKQKHPLLFAHSTMSNTISSLLFPRKMLFHLGYLALAMLLARSSSAQDLPLGTGVTGLDPSIEQVPLYQLQEGISCPTTTIGFGVFAGNGNQWGNHNFAPYNSNNAGGTNAGGIAGIKIPLGGPLAEYCRKQADKQLRRSEANLLTQTRNNALLFLAQCNWMEKHYAGFRQKQTNASSNENRKIGSAFELFQECPGQSTRIAGYISPEQEDARSNKENQSANPNKRYQSVTQPQDSYGRKSTEDDARNPPLGNIVPIAIPQQVQVSPR